MATLPQNHDANLLVGFDTSDDAGVYRLREDLAIVNTADFITPPVDDPFMFGQIAAANALSDIFAMGAKPLTCLNLAGFPSGKLPDEVLQQIIAGALDKITEAGAVLAGGHTTRDDEPKFGLSVTGVVHPDKIWRNIGAKPGDALILTKPIGSGVLLNANLKGWVSDAALQKCLQSMIELNKTAAEIFTEFDVHAATDVTGFGLAGHAYEMTGESVRFEIMLDKVPIMDEALAMYEKGMGTGSNLPNRQQVSHTFRFDRNVEPWHEEIVFDPQTSGGLLVAIPGAEAEKAVQRLRNNGIADATIIGNVFEKQPDGISLIIR